MKKILLAASLFFASLGFATAQQAPTKAKAKKEAKMDKAADKKEMKTAKVAGKKEAKMDKAADKKEMKTAKVAEKKEDKMEKATANGLKKDGTPDMRMKENKVTAKTTVAGPVKKNGTPDMRYKANKKK